MLLPTNVYLPHQRVVTDAGGDIVYKFPERIEHGTSIIDLGRVTLEQISTIRDHLMESNQFTHLGEQRRTIQVSGKLCNNDDGLIWPTGGRFSASSGHCCAFLVVVKTKAESTPRQQTRKIGQVIPYGRNLL